MNLKTDLLSVSLAERLPCEMLLEERRKAFCQDPFPIRGCLCVAWGLLLFLEYAVNVSALEGGQPHGNAYFGKE